MLHCIMHGDYSRTVAHAVGLICTGAGPVSCEAQQQSMPAGSIAMAVYKAIICITHACVCCVISPGQGSVQRCVKLSNTAGQQAELLYKYEVQQSKGPQRVTYVTHTCVCCEAHVHSSTVAQQDGRQHCCLNMHGMIYNHLCV